MLLGEGRVERASAMRVAVAGCSAGWASRSPGLQPVGAADHLEHDLVGARADAVQAHVAPRRARRRTPSCSRRRRGSGCTRRRLRTAMREACSLAIEISRTGYSPLAKRHAVTYTSWRAASIFVAISANLWRITWKWPIALPNASRSLAYCERAVEAALRARDAAGGADHALALELPHDVVEALALLAEHRRGGHAHVLEGEQRGVGGVHAELLRASSRGSRRARPSARGTGVKPS